MATRSNKSKSAPPAELAEEDLPSIHWATEEEWHDLIDRTAQHYLHMGADEFLRRWKAGEFPNPDGTPMMNVVMLLSIEEQRAGARAIRRRQRQVSQSGEGPDQKRADAASR